MKRIEKYIGWCLLVFIPLGVYGQGTANPFTIQSVSQTLTEQLSQTFQDNGLHTLDLGQTISVYGVAISGHIVFHDANNSMVRVTAVCADGIEYLVYEISPLLSDGQDFDIEDVAMETAVLDAENIVKLNVMLVNATFNLTNVKYNRNATPNVSRLKNAVAVDQEEALIERLNENLERQGHLWRAGKTSLSSMTYEQKKAVFGDPVPYLGGYEYYRGGIFVMPDYVPQKATDEDALFVKEWDWRNRHGKNWMTSIKDQGKCNSCVIFALLGTIEAYANLYYNRKIDLDLAEQELLCATAVPICNTGATFEYVYGLLIKNGGVMEESCFPYVGTKPPCNQCNNPTEKLNVDSVNIFHTIDQAEIKRMLFKAPIAISSEKAWHGMVLTGYKRLEAGDEVSYPNKRSDKIWESEKLAPNSPLIGSTAWLVKNSWGDWGDNGYCLMVEDICNVEKDKAEITGKIHSLQYTDDDIVIEDADGDGYYFWGIGERPQNLPAGVPEQADGDDSDPNAGPLDEFGYSRNLHPDNFESIYIRNRVEWTNPPKVIYPYIFIQQGGELIISGTTRLNRSSKIFVQTGGKLTIDGGTVEQADVMVSQGGTCILRNNGILRLGEGDSFKPESGSVVRIESGSIRK